MKHLLKLISFALLLAALVHPAQAQNAEGLVAAKSPHSAKDTMNKFEEVVKARGLNVFARIDHAAGAQRIGKSIRATEVLIFGNPQGGTPLMECAQSVGIDLPLKALVWEDASNQVWLAYNDPLWMGKRHNVAACPAIGNIGKALESMVEAALK